MPTTLRSSLFPNPSKGATQEKGRAPRGCPPLVPLGNLSAAAADQQAVTVEVLTCPGFAAVLVYVNWHCAGVVAAVT